MTETKSPRSIQLLEFFKFYFLFLRYIVVGLTSFLMDVGVFALCYLLITHQKLSSLVIGRLIAGSFNFYFNKYLVYRSLEKGLLKREAFRYLLLAIGIFLISYRTIQLLTTYFHIHIIDAKIIIDILLFCINFVVQKYLFRPGMQAEVS
ncbi:GtrA family protein [Coxiella-like endosymbiont]|uniref:GtrA family protein n=1 Tax=Coxiella-like endosymbiont TaxID=1592897 RepID=UPI00272BD68B|nr:GtrA family protein [Coxiella-like endosymbiont]